MQCFKQKTTKQNQPWWYWAVVGLIVGSLAACSVTPLEPTTPAGPTPAATDPSLPPDTDPLPPPLARAKSQWVPVRWSELPGWGQDRLHEAWNAWLRSCERPAPTIGQLCADVRRLSIASAAEQQYFVQSRLQPYRIEASGNAQGLMTGYYEPMLVARRTPDERYRYPLYSRPSGWRSNQTWFTRQEIDTLPQAQAALQGKAIAWLADPIDMMLLHIQGSGRLQIQDAAGRTLETVRVAFAGTNNQPYRSITTWLRRQGAPTAPWPEATKTWAQNNPDQVNELLWSNPRYVFFQEEPLNALDAQFGPRGAQGVALTPGRSIAVDAGSIPYGTPVWLSSQGPGGDYQRLVMAQDTGSAIVGAVRADFFTGWGDEALAQAAVLKQPLYLWALWPKR